MITNDIFSKEEKRLLDFILQQDFEKKDYRLHRPIAKKQIGVVGRGKTAQSAPVSTHAGRTRSDCRATPVSQNQVRQCEQHIQFGGLFSQTSVSRFSIPELPLNDRKYVFYLYPNR